MTTARPTAAALLEHQGFLRRLARSLVFDEHRADDLVQDSMVVALERGVPEGGRLRAWLAGIVRNRARRTFRDERRLRERHRKAARPEALPSTDAVAARLEAQRAIADAVASLDEPGRSAVVYRYLDGIKPASIATKLDLPVRTVESRLRRARNKLRDALDHQFGGRAAWRAALLPIAGVPVGASSLSSTTAAAGASGASTPTAAATIFGATVMSAQSVAGICLLAALAGAGIAWVAKPVEQAPPTPVSSTPAPAQADGADGGPALASSDLIRAHARISELERELAAAEAATRIARQELEAARGAPAAPPESDEHLADAKALKAHRYRHEKFDKSLASIDWKQAAVSMHQLGPKISQLATAATSGLPVHELHKEVGRLNGPLVEIAFRLNSQGVPGSGPNGAFTHPAVSVNMVYATLLEAGLPLNDAQVLQLKALGDQQVKEEAALREREKSEPFAFATLWQESTIRDRFYKAVDQILMPDQREVLHPGALKDRIQGDLFSAALLWPTTAQAALGATREAIVERITTMVTSQFQIEASDGSAVARVAAEYVEKLSHEALAPLGALEKAGFIKFDRIREAGEPMLAFYKELANELAHDAKKVEVVKQTTYILLPVLAK